MISRRSRSVVTENRPLAAAFVPLIEAQRAFHLPTARHGERVGRIARLIAEESNQIDPDVAEIAGQLHDIGKLSVSRELLEPDTPCYRFHADWLDDHCRVGAEIVSKVDHPIAPVIAAAILAHHERADGSGYPEHLAGDRVDPLGSVIGMADCVDALMGRGVEPSPDLCEHAVSIVNAAPEQFPLALRAWFHAAVTANRAEFMDIAAAAQIHPGPPPGL